MQCKCCDHPNGDTVSHVENNLCFIPLSHQPGTNQLEKSKFW